MGETEPAHVPTALSLVIGACVEGSEVNNGQAWERNGGFLIWVVLILFIFYLIAQLCDGHLTRSLELIVAKFGISEDVAGATFLAMAGSAPELFCSIIAVFYLESDSGIGNIVGSALFNLLVIIGVTPAFSEHVLDIWWFPTCRDAFWYGIAILELLLVLRDGFVDSLEAAAMVITYIAYILSMWQNVRIMKTFGIKPPEGYADDDEPLENSATAKVVPSPNEGPSDPSILSNQNGGKDAEGGKPDEDVENGLAKPDAAVEAWGDSTAPSTTGAGPEQDAAPKDGGEQEQEGEEEEEKPDPLMCCVDRSIAPLSDGLPIEETKDKALLLFSVVCLWLLVFTYGMLDFAERVGCIIHVPKVVMGQIVLAAGTSVPDCMASIVVAKKGKGDMAVANAVGSNTFDILLGLGGPWLLKTLWDGKPLPVPTEALIETVAMLSVCLVSYVLAIAACGWRLRKGMGVGMVCVYFACITWILVGPRVKSELGIGGLSEVSGY
jgi:K+-dependent Na+/Ca+ exchanger-like protein